MIDRAGGIQWPLPEGHPRRRWNERLFEDGRYFTSDGRAKFFFAEPRPLPEPTNDRFPLLLLGGRGSSSQWHTQTRTKRSAVLQRLSPTEAYVELSPVDARSLGIEPDERVNVSSQRGAVVARAFVTNCVKPGQSLHPDALRNDESAHICRVRSVLAPARIQGLRGACFEARSVAHAGIAGVSGRLDASSMTPGAERNGFVNAASRRVRSRAPTCFCRKIRADLVRDTAYISDEEYSVGRGSLG